MNTDRLPTFICIGGMKCGTTSLSHYLRSHPEVCMSDSREPDFFTDRSDKDLEWYRQQFQESGRACGERSTSYTKYPLSEGVPKRMHDLLPHVRLIYLVRDPVERAISHYTHNWIQHRETEPIDDALLPVEESWYVTVSRYHMQLTQYLEYYSLDDILLVQSEHLRENRQETLENIFRFIEVDPSSSGGTENEYNRSEERERATAVGSFLIRSGVGQFVKEVGKALVPSRMTEIVKEALWHGVEKPEPSEGVRAEVREYLREEAEDLRRLTGRSFSSWTV